MRHPSGHFPYFSEFFEAADDGGMVDVELLGQDPRRQALVLFHGRQKGLIIEIGGAASSGFILQACVFRFESIEPLIDRFSTDCSFAKEVVEIPKCLGSGMAFSKW